MKPMLSYALYLPFGNLMLVIATPYASTKTSMTARNLTKSSIISRIMRMSGPSDCVMVKTRRARTHSARNDITWQSV